VTRGLAIATMWRTIVVRVPCDRCETLPKQLLATHGSANFGSALLYFPSASAHGPPTSSVVLAEVRLDNLRANLALRNELETRPHRVSRRRLNPTFAFFAKLRGHLPSGAPEKRGSGCPHILKVCRVNFRGRLLRQRPVELMDKGCLGCFGLSDPFQADAAAGSQLEPDFDQLDPTKLVKQLPWGQGGSGWP
jgi:hypothetical protein